MFSQRICSVARRALALLLGGTAASTFAADCIHCGASKNKKCGIDLKTTIETATFNPDKFLQKSVVSRAQLP